LAYNRGRQLFEPERSTNAAETHSMSIDWMKPIFIEFIAPKRHLPGASLRPARAGLLAVFLAASIVGPLLATAKTEKRGGPWPARACAEFFAPELPAGQGSERLNPAKRKLAPARGGYAIGMLFSRRGGALALGLANYATGSHPEIVRAAEKRYGPELSILWGGEVALSSPFRPKVRGNPQIVEINETSGYLKNLREALRSTALPWQPVDVAVARRLISGMAPGLVDASADAIAYSPSNQHLFAPLNDLFPAPLPNGETARHRLVNMAHASFGNLILLSDRLKRRLERFIDEGLEAHKARIDQASAELWEQLADRATRAPLEVFAQALSLDGIDCSKLSGILESARTGALRDDYLGFEEITEIATLAESAMDAWSSAQANSGRNIKFIEAGPK
jgi:hypothetical protein